MTSDMDLIEVAILALLLGGVGYGFVLSRRLDRLRRALVEFGPALEAFCAAVDRSEQSVGDLRKESVRLKSVAANANRSVGVQGREEAATPNDDREVLINTMLEIVRGRRRGC